MSKENDVCLNCGQVLKPKEGHFVPPGMGFVGFFMCKPKGVCATCKGAKEVENSSSAIAYGGPEDIPCPTCSSESEDESQEREITVDDDGNEHEGFKT